MHNSTAQGCTEHGRMLMTYGLATTLCCRGLEIKAAYKIWDETESGDHRLAGRKHRYDDLVTKEKTLLAERRDRQQQLAGGAGSAACIHSHPISCQPISAAHHPACSTTAAAQHLPA